MVVKMCDNQLYETYLIKKCLSLDIFGGHTNAVCIIFSLTSGFTPLYSPIKLYSFTVDDEDYSFQIDITDFYFDNIFSHFPSSYHFSFFVT